MASWLIPLLLLPGVGLLLMSTSIRFAQLDSEIHHLMSGGHPIGRALLRNLKRRVTLYRNALMSLYSAAAAFALGSIIGAILDVMEENPEWVVIFFSCIGIIGLIIATITLIYETSLLLKVMHAHLDEITPTDTL